MNKKIIFSYSFLCFLLVFIYFNFIKRTSGFSLKKIISYHPYSPRWDMGSPTPEQEELLDRVDSQTFRYLGSGKECYVFLSEDEQFVIKFFKQKHMKTQLFMNYLPLPSQYKLMRNEILSRRSHMRKKHFTSYQIAYERLPEKTGVVYLHLNPTKNLNRSIRILAPSGKSYSVDMDQMEFLIQKRAERVFTHIMNLMDSHQISKAKLAISSILDMLIHRSAKGIGGGDNNCERNLGFIQDKAVHIDIGEFYPIHPSYPPPQELYDATTDLRLWLETRYPELAAYLEKQIQLRIRNGIQKYS